MRRVKIFRLGRFLAFPDASSPPRLDRVKKSWNVKHRRSDSVLPDTLDTCPLKPYASMSACAPTAESVPLVSSGRACRGGSAGVRKKYDLQLFSIVQTRPACTGATAENRLDAAPRRPRAAPAAPQLRTHRSRLPGRQRRLLEPAAASAAAPAAARLLLQTATRDARTGACAAATGCSGGHSGGGACAHSAAIAPAATAALAAALAPAAVGRVALPGLAEGTQERAETRHERPKDGSEGWKWTPRGGQGWDGGGGRGRARGGRVEARRSSGRPRSRGRRGPGEGAAHLRRGPEAR